MNSFWTVPRIWTGASAFIIGGGPSLLDLNLGLITDKNVIGINDAYLLGSWIDYNIFGDTDWYNIHCHAKAFKAYTGTHVAANDKMLHEDGIPTLSRRKNVITTVPNTIGWFTNTGVSAINLAILLGCKKVILLGFDLGFRKGESNWHENIKKQKPSRYERFIASFEQAAPQIDKLGVEVLNATPNSSLTCFPYVRYEDVAR